MTNSRILTIGHSNHQIETFMASLMAASVSRIVDIRSHPFSRLHPQFNQASLTNSLQKQGISYLFLGASLGGRGSDETCYKEGRVSYRYIANTTVFKAGLEQVMTESRTSRIALMCAEREPLECHRALLVARELAKFQVDVDHIHADGRIESHVEAIARLVAMFEDSHGQGDLFRSPSQVIEEAYERQEARVAFRRPDLGRAIDKARV